MSLSLPALQDVVINALEDIKGQNILVFDAQPLTSMFDRVVMVSGTSNRQTRALAKNLHDKVKQAGGDVYGAEGEETGEWVLVDLGDIIVHIMQPAIREYYRLEEIWGKHPIDWQAERDAQKKKAAPRRKATAKKPITEKPQATKKTASTSGAQPANKVVSTSGTQPAKKTASTRSPKPSKKASTQPTGNKSATAKKIPSMPVANKSTNKKPAGKKTAAKETAAKNPLTKRK